MSHRQHTLLLARDLRTPAPPPPRLPGDLTRQTVTTASDEPFAALNRFCAADGFPAGWAERMLAQGRQAYLLLDKHTEVVASAWIARGPYHVSEIRRTFDAGSDGDYYFGDFVAPAHRGRKLHPLLIDMRLEASRAADRAWALAMTHADNLPSVAGYRSAGFEVAADVRSRAFSRWCLDSIRWNNPQLPHARFSTEGVPLPGLGRLRRR